MHVRVDGRLCRKTVVEVHEQLTLDPTNYTDFDGSVYPFGMDPVSTAITECSPLRAMLITRNSRFPEASSCRPLS